MTPQLTLQQASRTFNVYAELGGSLENSARKPRLQFFGTITEICLGGTHVGGVGHRIFAAFRESECSIGQFFLRFVR